MNNEENLTDINNSITDIKPLKKKDFSQDLIEKLVLAKNLASGNQLNEGIEILLGIEKLARLANDIRTLKQVCIEIIELCYNKKNYDSLKNNILILSKKRGQKSSVITIIVQKVMEYLKHITSEEIQIDLIILLRNVSDGKIFVEKERAELTQLLSKIKEKNGNINEAATILQEVHVETYGAMTKLEKVEFILEQMRLTLLKKDYIRANIISKKIQRKTLEENNFQECKIKFYKLIIQYNIHEDNLLELSENWLNIFNTPEYTLKDKKKWIEALEHSVIFAILSPYTNHQSDLLHRLKQEKKINEEDELIMIKELIRLFTTKEIIKLPLFCMEKLNKHAFFLHPEKGKKWLDTLRTRVIEHNLRVIETHYLSISTTHLENILGLNQDELENHISNLVINGTIYARMNRPAKTISFRGPETPEEQLSDWSGDITKLLKLVESTCHLIQKENMMHKI